MLLSLASHIAGSSYLKINTSHILSVVNVSVYVTVCVEREREIKGNYSFELQALQITSQFFASALGLA